MQSRMCIVTVFVCCLLTVACHRDRTRSARSAPPATSYRVESLQANIDGASQSILGGFVTPEFEKAGVGRPLLGRFFAGEEYGSDRGRVAVVSHRMWKQRFASDPAVIGKELVLNGDHYTIVGVMPKSVEVPEGVEIWLPEGNQSKH